MAKRIARLDAALVLIAVLLTSVFVSGPQFYVKSYAQTLPADDFILKLNLAPSALEHGLASYNIGFVQLVSNMTGEPVLAPRDLQIELESKNPNIASVPPQVIVAKGTDYSQFAVGVTDLVGETEISALFGNQVASKTLRVVEASSQTPNEISLALNLPSKTMQIGSEVPFSVYLLNNGEVMQAPEDISVSFDYDRSLLQLSSSTVTIKKGDYYAIATMRTLEKSGNAFIKASTASPQLDTVTTVQISQTQPVAIKLYVFPDKVGVNEKSVDVFVGLVDASGNPTIASNDIKLDMFASSLGVQSISTGNAVIKKGEFGYYHRQSILFYSKANVTIGASAQGLGVSTDNFDVVQDPLLVTNSKANQKYLSIFTVPIGMPSDATSIVVYQLNAVEDDNDDGADSNGDGEIDASDHHAIDDLKDGELYPIQSEALFSPNQGNLNVVTTDLTALRVVDPGAITAGSSYGTAILSAGRKPGSVDVSVSLSNLVSNTNPLMVTGSLTPVKTTIFSPAGANSPTEGRIHFNSQGVADLFVMTLDSSDRPARALGGVQYLIQPTNELTEIVPDTTFAKFQVKSSQFSLADQTATITAIPIGVNSDPTLQVESTFSTAFYGSVTGMVIFPLESVIGFSRSHPIGVVQLADRLGNPVLASEDTAVSLSSSREGSTDAKSVTIPAGKSFATFRLITSGKAESLSVSAFADGIRSTSSSVVSVLADLPASFSQGAVLTASQPSTITVETIEGTSVLWTFPSGFKTVKADKASVVNPATGKYEAKAQVIAPSEGSYIIDLTLLKDGFKPTRLANSVKFGEFQKPLKVSIFYNVPAIEYNQPVMMSVRVVDDTSKPVAGATVRLNSGPNATAMPSEGVTDSTGTFTFQYTATGASSRGIVTATAEKTGYSLGVMNSQFTVENVPTVFPQWLLFGIAGAGAAGAGMGAVHHIKRPKVEQQSRKIRARKPADDESDEVGSDFVE